MNIIRRCAKRVFALVAACAVAASAQAQTDAAYPTKPVKIIAPYATGGVTDIGARYFASMLERQLGAPFIVENRPGAGGTIGAAVVVRSSPDGYTLLFSGGSSLTSIFNKDGAIDPLKELLPISSLHQGSYYLFVSSKLPVNNLQELVAYSKRSQGGLNLGVQSTTALLAMAWLKNRTGIEYVDIPYKSGGAVGTAMQAGEVQMSFDAVTGYLPLLRASQVRALLVAGKSRAPITPNVPSADEAGVPGFAADYVQGLWAPLGTSNVIIGKVAVASRTMLAPEDVQAQVTKLLGTKAVGSSPEELRRAIETEVAFWSEAARIAKYRP